MVANCNKFYFVHSGDECDTIASSNGISRANFNSFNPGINSICSNLIAGDNVCIGLVGSSVTTSQPPSATTGNGIATPSPTQGGLVGNCKTFAPVISGDSCISIETAYGISASQFLAWNKGINAGCTNLLAGNYVCVAVLG